MMISKVKPLHKKVEETTQAIDNAEHKMSVLENKRQTLEVRLAGLAKGFEEATIDKNTQEEKTIQMDKMLETAARLRKVCIYCIILYEVPKISVIQSDIRATAENRLRSTDVPAFPASLGLESRRHIKSMGKSVVPLAKWL